MDHILNVEIMLEHLLAHVYLVILVTRQIVNQNALSILNVPVTKLVFGKNAWTHAQVHVELEQFALQEITFRFVLALKDILEIHFLIATQHLR